MWGPRPAPGGLEVALPFESADEVPAAIWNLTPGFPIPLGAFGHQTLSTFPLGYVDFDLVGLDLAAVISMENPNEIPPLIVVESWGLSGGHNQIYAPQIITQAGGQVAQLNGPGGQVQGYAGGGILTYSKTLPSLREDRVGLLRNNTAQLAVSLRIGTQAGDVDIVLYAALKLRVTKDDFVEERGL